MATKDKKSDAHSRQKGKRETQVNIRGSNNAVATRPLSVAASIRIVLQNSRPVLTFLIGVVLIGTAIASLYWWSRQPRRMTGDFNIAVAQFAQTGDSTRDIAESVSQNVFRYLDDQANLITFEDVQVAHKNIRLISSAEEARELADRIHAQVVIYGDVTTVGDQVHLTPQFYVAEAFRANVSELNGQQRLAAPITFPLESILTPSSVSMKLIQERTVIMTEFTKALVYLATDNLPLSQEAIDQAILHSEQQGRFEGQEVIYLFASEIARLQGNQESAQGYVNKALQLNPDYGRGYIAKANIYYDEGNLFQAKENYEKAQGLSGQPFGAYVVEKASLGIGNSCWVQLQHVRQNPVPDPLGSSELEQCALVNYQKVITLYRQQKNPERILKEMAAWAYYSVGAVDQQRDQPDEAQQMYDQALKLTRDQELIQRIEAGLKEVKK